MSANISQKIDYVMDVFPGHPSVFFSKAMIYQAVLGSKLAQLDRQTAISELKKKLSLHPRKPRVKNAQNKFYKKKLGQYVLNRFKGFMVFFLGDVFIVSVGCPRFLSSMTVGLVVFSFDVVQQEDNLPATSLLEGDGAIWGLQLLALLAHAHPLVPQEAGPGVHRSGRRHKTRSKFNVA